MSEPEQRLPTPLPEGLRAAILGCGLAYNELGRRAGVAQGQISRFVLGERDLTLSVAARLFQVLGFGMARVRPLYEGQLPAPPPSTRQRKREGLPPPESAQSRGKGARMDLEAGQERVRQAQQARQPGKGAARGRGKRRTT